MHLCLASLLSGQGLSLKLRFVTTMQKRSEMWGWNWSWRERKEEMMMKGCGSISESSILPSKWCLPLIYFLIPVQSHWHDTNSRPLALALCGDVFSPQVFRLCFQSIRYGSFLEKLFSLMHEPHTKSHS